MKLTHLSQRRPHNHSFCSAIYSEKRRFSTADSDAAQSRPIKRQEKSVTPPTLMQVCESVQREQLIHLVSKVPSPRESLLLCSEGSLMGGLSLTEGHFQRVTQLRRGPGSFTPSRWGARRLSPQVRVWTASHRVHVSPAARGRPG